MNLREKEGQGMGEVGARVHRRGWREESEEGNVVVIF